jgi:hypothetical protein
MARQFLGDLADAGLPGEQADQPQHQHREWHHGYQGVKREARGQDEYVLRAQTAHHRRHRRRQSLLDGVRDGRRPRSPSHQPFLPGPTVAYPPTVLAVPRRPSAAASVRPPPVPEHDPILRRWAGATSRRRDCAALATRPGFTLGNGRSIDAARLPPAARSGRRRTPEPRTGEERYRALRSCRTRAVC